MFYIIILYAATGPLDNAVPPLFHYTTNANERSTNRSMGKLWCAKGTNFTQGDLNRQKKIGPYACPNFPIKRSSDRSLALVVYLENEHPKEHKILQVGQARLWIYSGDWSLFTAAGSANLKIVCTQDLPLASEFACYVFALRTSYLFELKFLVPLYLHCLLLYMMTAPKLRQKSWPLHLHS